MTAPRTAVFDCNVFLQAMLTTRGYSYSCWLKILSGEVNLAVTPYILAEIRKLPTHRKLQRFATFTAERVERFIEELLDTADLIADPPPWFTYTRDPNDAHYVDVAIATGSLLVVTNEKDLLDLMSNWNVEGKKLRTLYPLFQVLTPEQFLVHLAI